MLHNILSCIDPAATSVNVLNWEKKLGRLLLCWLCCVASSGGGGGRLLLSRLMLPCPPAAVFRMVVDTEPEWGWKDRYFLSRWLINI